MTKIKAFHLRNLLYIGSASIVIKIYLAKYLTYYGDLLTFKAWGVEIANNGFNSFYNTVWSDYLPGYLYILALLAKIQGLLTNLGLYVNDDYLYKLPSILADFGNSLFIYLIAKMFVSPKKAFIVGVFALFNPAFLANSTFWGQAESFMTFFLLSSFYFLMRGNYAVAAVLIGLGQTVKPIAVFAIPIYLIYLFRKKIKPVIVLSFLPIILITMVIIFIPFSNDPNILKFILDRHLVTANQYPYTSLNAFNLWAVMSNFWISDDLKYLAINFHTWGVIFFSLIYFTLIMVLTRRKKIDNYPVFFAWILTICYLAVFLLLTRIHERHMFYGLSFSALLLAFVSWRKKLAIFTLNLVYLINLGFAYAQINNKPAPLEYNYVILLSIINMGFFFYIFLSFLQTYGKEK